MRGAAPVVEDEGPPAYRLPAFNRDYVKDDDLDREALALRNARLLLERGEDPAFVAWMLPDVDLDDAARR